MEIKTRVKLNADQPENISCSCDQAESDSARTAAEEFIYLFKRREGSINTQQAGSNAENYDEKSICQADPAYID